MCGDREKRGRYRTQPKTKIEQHVNNTLPMCAHTAAIFKRHRIYVLTGTHLQYLSATGFSSSHGMTSHDCFYCVATFEFLCFAYLIEQNVWLPREAWPVPHPAKPTKMNEILTNLDAKKGMSF